MPTDPGARLVLGTHDLGPEAMMDEDRRNYWMPFAEFEALLAQLDLRAAAKDITIELTSDDGFASDYNCLLPWLVAHNRRASFFVPTGFVGRGDHLSLSQLQALAAAGMTIGLHGAEHLNWTRASEAELEREIIDGKARLEDMIGAPVATAAPPYGAYDRRSVAMLKRAKISRIYTCRGGYAFGGLLQPRIMVQRGAPAKSLLALAERGAMLSDRLRTFVHGLQLVAGV